LIDAPIGLTLTSRADLYPEDMDQVPVVDISNPTATSLADLDRACRDHGFFLLSGHGLDDLIARTFAAAPSFFDAPTGVKNSVRRTETNPLGYTDRELTKQRRDHKEAFDITDPMDERVARYNRWPVVDGFREALTDHFNACSDLAMRASVLVLAALGLSHESAEHSHGDRVTSTMRLNRYSVGDPLPESERTGLAELADVALGQHTDLGLITLLIQDDVGGLQTESTEDGWIDVEPRPGTIVVNLGDTMQVWTNDRYRAALHRVRPMTTSTRMSIPYFFNPKRHAVIEPIAELAEGGARYRPFAFRQLLDARSADNYADAGGPDTQISDFRVTV
jgi:isopenicillin N synthase-like dioxygenase